MRNRFDRQLRQLNQEMVEMGDMIEQAIESAVDALIRRDVEKAAENMKYDIEIDHQEKEIESLCMKLLMQQQPVAGDLRVISSALKMITDMERIGDQAADISELTIHMAKESGPAEGLELSYIEKMAKETTAMVVGSVEAYVNKNLEQARAVIRQDDAVDDLFHQAKKNIIEQMKRDSELDDQAADLLMVAKYFERIGDHAENIAEWVIYSMNGARD